MPATPYIILGLFAAIGIDLWMMDRLRARQAQQKPPMRLTFAGLPKLFAKRSFTSLNIKNAQKNGRFDLWHSPLIELAWVIIFAIWAGRWLLPAPPLDHVITWQEGPVVTHDLFQWVQIQNCGLCGLWNGGMNGGAPTFVDLLTPLLHPVVVVLTLLFGPTHGAALVALAASLLGGIATWWLAQVTGLGRFARLWAGTLGAVAGGLVGKMDSYNMMLMFSQASAWLAIPPLVMIGWRQEQRAAGWLGLTAGLLLLSGQGYYQVGYFICLIPAAFLLFGFQPTPDAASIRKNYLIGAAISLLIAGVLFIPFLRFSSNFLKPTDVGLQNFQPLENIPLALLIRDLNFFRQPLLGHDIMFYVNFNYIGWVPVLLALTAVLLVPARDRRLLVFYGVAILLLFGLVSKEFARLIQPIYPGIDQLRYPASIAGLALPLVIVLAAWGLDALFKISRPEISLRFASGKQIGAGLGLLAAIPALLAIIPNLQLAQYWLDSRGKTSPPNVELMAAITPQKTAWLRPPANLDQLNFFYQRNIKISETYHSWTWRNREAPQAEWYVESRDINPYPQYVKNTYFELDIDQIPGREYALVTTPNGQRECISSAVGGFIDVICNLEEPGMLEVKENLWQGWYVWVDDTQADLVPGRWLAVNLPAGKHHVRFRYYPADIWVGLVTSLIGLAWAGKILFGKRPPAAAAEIEDPITPLPVPPVNEVEDDPII